MGRGDFDVENVTMNMMAFYPINPQLGPSTGDGLPALAIGRALPAAGDNEGKK